MINCNVVHKILLEPHIDEHIFHDRLKKYHCKELFSISYQVEVTTRLFRSEADS